jgi:hypothetical protein
VHEQTVDTVRRGRELRVVVIHGVGGLSVGVGGLEDGVAATGADGSGLRHASELVEERDRQTTAVRRGAGQHHSQRVEHLALGQALDVIGHLFERRIGGEGGKGVGGVHGNLGQGGRRRRAEPAIGSFHRAQ